MDLQEIYKALRSEYNGKTWSDDFMEIHVDMRSDQVICWFDIDKADDEDDSDFEEKRDNTIGFYDEVVRFLVDNFGEEFKYEDPRVSSDYIYKNNMHGKYEIVLDDDGENPAVIAIWENDNVRFINESEEDARSALARELGLDKSKVRLSEDDNYSHYEPDYTFQVQMKDGSKAIYLVYDNEESAKTAAVDDLGEHFQDAPEILSAAIDYFGFPTFAEYINGVDEDELADIEQLKDELYPEEFAQYVVNNLGVDYRGFAEFNIEQLGPAWHIADYDGEELELPNGMLAYRAE